MAENINILNTLIQLRRGTEAQWESVKDAFIPAAGEPCATLDGKYAGQVKIGDGVQSWGQLKYAGVVDKADLSADGKAIVIKDGVITLSGVDAATAGQTFKINAAGDGIEWYAAVTAEDMEKKVDTKVENTETGVSSTLTNTESGINAETINTTGIKTTVAVINGDSPEVKIASVDSADSKGARLIIRKDGVYYTTGQTNDSILAQNEILTKADLEGALHFKGSVATRDDLPAAENNEAGDIWQVTETGEMVIWNGSTNTWDEFHAMNMDGYVTEEELGTTLGGYATIDGLKNGDYEIKMPDVTDEASGLMTPELLLELEKLGHRAYLHPLDYQPPVPNNVLINYYTGNEMRLMFPADFAFTVNREGKYFIPVRFFGPDNAHYFQESNPGDNPEITDTTYYEFENNDFAGIDPHGGKYSLVWLPVAQQNDDGSWLYFGSKSTVKKFVGWSHRIDWFDSNKNRIGTTFYRVNLTNESLLGIGIPYFSAENLDANEVQAMIDESAKSQKVSTDQLYNGEKIFVIDGNTPMNLVPPTPPTEETEPTPGG